MMLLTRLRKLIGILPVADFRRALRHGVAATVEHIRPLQPLKIASVLDVGANVGQFALIARHLWPTATIFSFEPMAAAGARYQRALAGSPQVTLVPLALGASPGEADFHLSRQADSSSLLAITPLQVATFPGTEAVAKARVTVARLDQTLSLDRLPRPLLLKIDVQGFEIPVLEGCGALIDCVDHVYCECSFKELYQGQALAHDVVRWLDQRDLTLEGIYNLSTDRQGRAVQADFLFGRSGRR
jgi:FkbM family methyltransferase